MKQISPSLEQRIATLTMPPKRKPSDVRYYSQFAYLPVDFIIDFIGFNNYREHSLKETNLLSKSIKSKGLLEPIILHYDTSSTKWDFIDGEGRFWACYQNGADEVPVKILYDVPEETRLRMKIAANSTKTKIDSEDLALFTKRLYELLSKLNIESSGKYGRYIAKAPTVKELSEIIGRHPDTVRKYFVFNNLHAQVTEYVNNHRDQNLFSRSVQIGRSLGQKNHQREFLSYVLREQHKRELEEKRRKAAAEKKKETYHPRQIRFSETEFREKLKRFALLKMKKGKFELESPEEKYVPGDNAVRDIRQSIYSTLRYINAFAHLLENFPEIKDSVRHNLEKTGHITKLKEQYDSLIAGLPKELVERIDAYMQKPSELTFREKIFEQAALRRKKQDHEYARVETVGDKVKYIPLDQIRFAKNQLRSRYNPESIDALAEELKEYGQIKPGLVVKTRTKNGKPVYTMIYGHTRYLAAKKAGLKHFEAFVRSDLKPLEISILQSMEDLSEEDTPAERARVLNKHYSLMRLKAEKQGRAYSKEDFTRDFKHLGNKKTLRDALEFMELDIAIRNMATEKIIGYDAAIKVGRLPKDNVFDVLYPTMSSQLRGAEIDMLIRKVRQSQNQMDLFSEMPIPKSYSRVIETFIAQSMHPFILIYTALNNGTPDIVKKRILQDRGLFEGYAAIYKSITRLEKSLYN